MTYIINNKKVTLAPNQRIIQINKVGKFIDLEANDKAQKELKSGAYSLYMYFVKKVNNAIWVIYNDDIENTIDMSEPTYQKNFKVLIEKGYIVEKPIDTGEQLITKNAFHFYENPFITTPNYSDLIF